MEPIETFEYKDHTVNVYYDDDVESPAEWGNFELITFGRRRNKVTDQPDWDCDEETRAKLEDGRAFWVDIYEHSGTAYHLAGESLTDGWDTASKGGIIIFSDEYASNGATYDERRDMARQDLDTYTQWANGDIYTYWVAHPSHESDDQDCMSGVYGLDEAIQDAKSMIDSEESQPYHHHYIKAPKASALHN